MKIKVLFFASAREAADGLTELTIDNVPEGSTTAFVRQHLAKAFHGLSELANTITLAVNEEYIQDEMTLCDGDTVALIPPISGG